MVIHSIFIQKHCNILQNIAKQNFAEVNIPHHPLGFSKDFLSQVSIRVLCLEIDVLAA